jgi:hypothetical protein
MDIVSFQATAVHNDPLSPAEADTLLHFAPRGHLQGTDRHAGAIHQHGGTVVSLMARARRPRRGERRSPKKGIASVGAPLGVRGSLVRRASP